MTADDPCGGLARDIARTRSQLTSLLEQVAEVFDQSAELAEQHARRVSAQGDDRVRKTEWERAEQAREAAERARAHARRLRTTAPGRTRGGPHG